MDEHRAKTAHQSKRGRISDPLETLYRRYSLWLRRRLRRRFGVEAAEDLVQEAYLRLGRSGKADAVAHPRALLLKIATNAGLDQVRRVATRGAVQAWAEPEGVDESHQDETILLKEIVLGLPPILRDVFVLNRFAGRTYREIAEQLGISEKTVEWRMSRALALCAERLRESPEGGEERAS